MLQKIRNMKKSRRGFTLVEIIVVLVILAILAAFTIPAMLGFVNDARSKAQIAEAREVYVAAQSAATESATTSGSVVEATMISKTQALITGDLNITITASTSDPGTTYPGAPGNGKAVIYYNSTTAKVYGVAYQGSSAANGIYIHEGGSEVIK